MASARRTGTNEQTTTYDSAGGGETYTDLADWEIATDTDHTATGDSETDVLLCTAGVHSDDIDIGGGTGDATYFRYIKPNSGQFHSGIPDGSGVEFNAAVQIAFRLGTSSSDDYTQFQDLVLKSTVDLGTTSRVVQMRGDNTALIGCLLYDSDNAGAGTMQGTYNFTASKINIGVDCLIHNMGGSGDRGWYQGNGTGYVYNCTIEQGDTGQVSVKIGSSGVLTTTNCIIVGTQENDGTYTEATSVTSSPSYVNASINDFHLSAAEGSGTADLSADGTYAFDDDVDFNTLTWTDAGFHEFQSVGGRTTKNTDSYPLGVNIGMSWRMPKTIGIFN